MYEVKMTCTISLPGRIMYSEQECSKRIKTPLLIKRGKDAGKQVKDKDGNPVFRWIKGPDPLKHDSFDIIAEDNAGNEASYHVMVRKSKPAQEVVRISKEAYLDMISTNVPFKFRAPKGFVLSKEDKKTADKDSFMKNKTLADRVAWMNKTKEERLEWHMKEFARDMGGYLIDYAVFKD